MNQKVFNPLRKHLNERVGLSDQEADNSKPPGHATVIEGPRAKCHSSCSWNKQFQSVSRSQVLPTTSGRQQYAVLCKVGWTQTVLRFVDHGRQLEDDSLTNWKSMPISKKESDMIVFPCVRDKSSNRILDMLQLVQQVFIDAMTHGVAVVQSSLEPPDYYRTLSWQCAVVVWRFETKSSLLLTNAFTCVFLASDVSDRLIERIWSIVERNKIDREPRPDLPSRADRLSRITP